MVLTLLEGMALSGNLNKGDYVIEYTVERVSLELPIRQSHLVDVDSYIRELKEKNGWRNLPYKLITSDPRILLINCV